MRLKEEDLCLVVVDVPVLVLGISVGIAGIITVKLTFAYFNVKASNGILITFVSEEEFEKKSF